MFPGRTKVASQSNRAFSRMELIVVLAVLSVLLVIVLSAHAKPRNRVYQTTDVSNYRRLMQAMTSFAADHSDTLPESGWSTPAGSRTCWAYGVPVPGGQGGTLAAYLADLPGQLNAVTNAQLFPYLLDSRVFMCPADRPDNSLFFQRKIQVASYTWNGAINGYSSGNLPYKLSRFRPDAILQWECDDLNPFYFNDAVNNPTEGLSARHGLENWVGMFGGGVISMVRLNFFNLAAAGNANQLWCNPGTSTGH